MYDVEKEALLSLFLYFKLQGSQTIQETFKKRLLCLRHIINYKVLKPFNTLSDIFIRLRHIINYKVLKLIKVSN